MSRREKGIIVEHAYKIDGKIGHREGKEQTLALCDRQTYTFFIIYLQEHSSVKDSIDLLKN